MSFTRRQIVEGGIAGLLGMAATPALAGPIESLVRRRPDGSLLGGSSPFRMPHPGQPLPAQMMPQVQQASAVTPIAPRPTVPAQPRSFIERTVNPRLVAAARTAFDRHRSSVSLGDTVGIVDFSKMSSEPRFYMLDTASGQVREHHVAHGRGSDPAHTGFLQRFSNAMGSNATSEGAYVTSTYYDGKYGRSMRVRGLDYTNNNAEARAIVVHSAWYAEPAMLATHGMLGRSEGCFAMSYASLQETMTRLSPGHFIYAGRV